MDLPAAALSANGLVVLYAILAVLGGLYVMVAGKLPELKRGEIMACMLGGAAKICPFCAADLLVE
jgi:N-methylhydantoinase B/oxoprolinase/acetone carboxylase alpha subunit